MPFAKKIHNQKLTLLAVFIAGLAVATLGWYYSDRLNIAFGQSSDINMIREGRQNWSDSPSQGLKKCNPSELPKVTQKIDGCQVVTTTELCTSTRKYLNFEHTRSGVRFAESDVPKRGSVMVEKAEAELKESRKDVHKEVEDRINDVENYKKAALNRDLNKDDKYQQMTKLRDEAKSLERSVGNKCQAH